MKKLPDKEVVPNKWVVAASKLAGRNLMPCYEYWGWELAEATKTEVRNNSERYAKNWMKVRTQKGLLLSAADRFLLQRHECFFSFTFFHLFSFAYRVLSVFHFGFVGSLYKISLCCFSWAAWLHTCSRTWWRMNGPQREQPSSCRASLTSTGRYWNTEQYHLFTH